MPIIKLNSFGYAPYSETVGEKETMTNNSGTIVNPAPAPAQNGGLWSLAFWKGAGERAIKTACQTFVAVVGVTGVGTTLGLGQVNWITDLSVTGLATVLSFITSVGNANFTAGK